MVDSGLGEAIAHGLLAITPLPPDSPFISFISLNALTSALNFVVTANGVPAMFTPMAQQFADASGFSLTTVVMIQVFAYATPLLPYQASPIVVAIALGKVPVCDGVKLCLLVAIFSALILLPLNYLWFFITELRLVSEAYIVARLKAGIKKEPITRVMGSFITDFYPL